LEVGAARGAERKEYTWGFALNGSLKSDVGSDGGAEHVVRQGMVQEQRILKLFKPPEVTPARLVGPTRRGAHLRSCHD
jgi:hypothetical protein